MKHTLSFRSTSAQRTVTVTETNLRKEIMMEALNGKVAVFVYGTLMRDQPNHRYWRARE